MLKAPVNKRDELMNAVAEKKVFQFQNKRNKKPAER